MDDAGWRGTLERGGARSLSMESSGNITRVAVIGAGAFGQNHARVYRELATQNFPVQLVAVVDTNPQQALQAAAEFQVPGFDSIASLLADRTIVLDAASVAVPTVEHLAAARALMESGADVLIEKPLAPSLDEADEIQRIAQRTARVAQVGHLERFNPGLQATLPLVTHPMFFEVHRLSMFSPRSLDVDVVLDLMIHDLDIVLSLVQSEVTEIRAVGLPILSSRVDIANVRLEFASGCVANFTASRVSTEKIRKLRFFQPRQYISVDFTRQDVVAFQVEEPPEPSSTPMLSLAALAAGSGIRMHKPTVTKEEPLHAELKSFIAAVRNRASPLVTVADGRRALAIALDISAAIAGHQRRALL